MLSQRVLLLKPSAVIALKDKAEKLKEQGMDPISLSLGEPTWDTPQSICSAGLRAIQEGWTKYTPASGSKELKEAIAAYTNRWLGLTSVDTSQVTVSVGAKFILFSAFQSLCQQDDEVLIPTPHWLSYPSMVQLACANLVSIPTYVEEGFKLQPKILEKHITKKSKVLLINSPNNPSGATMNRAEWEALAVVLRAHPQIYIISDDIYNHMYFSDSPMAPHLLQVCPDLKDRVLCVNSVSKNYSMPGWRVGWAVGHPQIIQAMTSLQSQSVSCTCSISQAAATYALNECDKELDKMRQHLFNARDLALELFQAIPNLDIYPPEGSFYLWIGIKKLYGSTWAKGRIQSATDFVNALCEDKAILCVPGEEFHCPDYIRIHFAADKKLLLEASSRIKKFVQSLT